MQTGNGERERLWKVEIRVEAHHGLMTGSLPKAWLSPPGQPKQKQSIVFKCNLSSINILTYAKEILIIDNTSSFLKVASYCYPHILCDPSVCRVCSLLSLVQMRHAWFPRSFPDSAAVRIVSVANHRHPVAVDTLKSSPIFSTHLAEESICRRPEN